MLSLGQVRMCLPSQAPCISCQPQEVGASAQVGAVAGVGGSGPTMSHIPPLSKRRAWLARGRGSNPQVAGVLLCSVSFWAPAVVGVVGIFHNRRPES